jgi:putative hydrolase of the HAD superfamily
MIFFDIDETLLDFKGAEYVAVAALYSECSSKFSISHDEFYHNWCTVGKKHFNRYLSGEISFEQQKIERVKEIFSQINMIMHESDASDYFQVYLTHFEDNWKLFDDVIPCLQDLQDYELGIITNGNSDQQRKKLMKLGIHEYFKTIITASDAGVAKPNSRIFEIVCRRASKQPNDCFYVGDDFKTDILACGEVNMQGIWLNRRNEDNGNHHEWTITSLSELRQLISAL